MSTQSLSITTPSETPRLSTRLTRVSRAVVMSLLITILLFPLGAKWQNLVNVQEMRQLSEIPPSIFEDLVVFHTAGKFVIEGRGEDLYDLEAIVEQERQTMGRHVGTGNGMAYFNPPYVAVLFAPLGFLEIGAASIALFVVSLFFVVIAGILLQSLLVLKGKDSVILFWLAYLSLQSVYWTLAQGQLSILLLIGYLGFFLFQRRGQTRLSGFALALVLIKPQMLVLPLVVMVWKRRWTELQTLAAVGVILGILSIAISGPNVLWEYPAYALGSTGWEETGVTNERMYGWSGFLARLVENHSTPHVAALAVANVLTGVLALLAFRGAWQPRGRRFAFSFGGLIAASILINPHVWLQDLVLMAMIVGLGYVGSRGHSVRSSFWVMVGVTLWLVQDRTQHWLNDGVNALTPFLAGLLLLLVWQAIRRPAQSDDALAAKRHEELQGVASQAA